MVLKLSNFVKLTKGEEMRNSKFEGNNEVENEEDKFEGQIVDV